MLQYFNIDETGFVNDTDNFSKQIKKNGLNANKRGRVTSENMSSLIE